MAYLVLAVAGDCLCTIARRHGYSNCGTVRSDPANVGLLDRPLAAGDSVSIPQLRDGWVYSKIATSRRWTVRVLQPIAPPQPIQLRFVRKAGAAPAVANAVPNLGISRFITRSSTVAGDDDWVDHQQYDHDAASSRDVNTFCVEVDDPNPGTATVSVRLEALCPAYDHLRALAGWTRFTAGAERNRRTLVVSLGRPVAMPAGRYWSGDLRLVANDADHQARPHQTLLVTDLFDATGVGADIQILDQNVRATYEYAQCPRVSGARCMLAVTDLPLRRGREVPIEVFILRAAADGTNAANHNGLVSDQDVQRRIDRNCRRVWAQEELSFSIHAIRTVDPPNDMLTVADPNGADATGHAGGNSLVAGQVDLRVTNTRFKGAPVVHQLGPVAIAANATPQQTAAAIVYALDQLPNIRAQAMPCAPQGHAAQGSVDIVIRCADGYVTLDQLTPTQQQDATQQVAIVHLDVTNVNDDNFPSHYCAGGPPDRRLVFKAFVTDPTRLSIFVVQQQRGGLTTGALAYLHGGPLVDAAVRNCLTMNATQVDGSLDDDYAILPHELGHALTDADHTGAFAGVTPTGQPRFIEGSLMVANPTTTGNWYDNVRVTGQGSSAHDYELLADAAYHLANGGAWSVAPAASPLGLLELQTTVHDRILANGTLAFNNR
jgi:hypothetical protein